MTYLPIFLEFGQVAPDSFASKKGIPVNYEACGGLAASERRPPTQVHAINGLALVQQNQQRAPGRDGARSAKRRRS